MSATAAASKGAAAPERHGLSRAAAVVLLPMFILGFGLLLTGPAAAVDSSAMPLFLVDTPFVSPQDTHVYRVDPETGDMQIVAALGSRFSPLYGLAAASDSVLYATGSDNEGASCPEPGCLLLRIVMDPGSTEPQTIEVIGPVHHNGSGVAKVTGLTFRSDGTLWALGQDTDGLYTVSLQTAEAILVGTIDLDAYGGDITFTSDDRLLLWTNAGPAAGLYELDKTTAQASALELSPYAAYTGMAALGHGLMLYGSQRSDDRLYEIDAVAGYTGRQPQFTLGGAAFDCARGDLDSPYCAGDADCDDMDPCTVDQCSPGGCSSEPEPGCCTPSSADDTTCDGVDDDCDGLVDEDFIPIATACGRGACAAAGATTCVGGQILDSCLPGAPFTEICDGLDNDCNGVVDDVAPPEDLPFVTMQRPSESWRLQWSPVAGATGYDVVRGSGMSLIASHGDFNSAVDTCLADGLPASHLTITADPAEGGYYWYLVRPESCGVPGSYETDQPSQKGLRGPSISSAPGSCP